ncbi:MAG: HAD family hydrolase [Spirochaetota bacterium]
MLLRIGDKSFDAGLVIFDKDGTIVDIKNTWARVAESWLEKLLKNTGKKVLSSELYRSIGYNQNKHKIDEHGPLATATVEELRIIAATLLYKHGFSWNQARDLSSDSFKEVTESVSFADLVCPITDVRGLMRNLHEAGVRLAVITTDDREETVKTITLLNIQDSVDFLVCGDDPVPVKPAPEAVLEACNHTGVEPVRTAVVGDTVVDMLMAKNAGAGFRIGVLSGAGSRESLAPHADVLIESIEEIRIESAIKHI